MAQRFVQGEASFQLQWAFANRLATNCNWSRSLERTGDVQSLAQCYVISGIVLVVISGWYITSFYYSLLIFASNYCFLMLSTEQVWILVHASMAEVLAVLVFRENYYVSESVERTLPFYFTGWNSFLLASLSLRKQCDFCQRDIVLFIAQFSWVCKGQTKAKRIPFSFQLKFLVFSLIRSPIYIQRRFFSVQWKRDL